MTRNITKLEINNSLNYENMEINDKKRHSIGKKSQILVVFLDKLDLLALTYTNTSLRLSYLNSFLISQDPKIFLKTHPLKSMVAPTELELFLP